MEEKKLIVTADDFGLTESINEGIINAHCDGIVTRTSIVANGKAFNHAVSLSKKNKTLKVGIHLTLVGEEPINEPIKIKSLMGQNGLLLINYKAFLVRYILRKIEQREVYSEWESQIQNVMNSGIDINHIDSHQHLHILPEMFRIALALAYKYKINKIRMLHSNITRVRSLKELILILISNVNIKEIINSNSEVKYSDNFLGLKQSGNIKEDDILNFIDDMKHGIIELMCHPGYADNNYYQKYGHWNYNPEEELKALVSEKVKAKLKDKNIMLVS